MVVVAVILLFFLVCDHFFFRFVAALGPTKQWTQVLSTGRATHSSHSLNVRPCHYVVFVWWDQRIGCGSNRTGPLSFIAEASWMAVITQPLVNYFDTYSKNPPDRFFGGIFRSWMQSS